MIPAIDQFATIGRQAPPQRWFISGLVWKFTHYVFFIIESLRCPDIVGFTTLECRDLRIHPNKELAQCVTNILPARIGTETPPAPLGGNGRKRRPQEMDGAGPSRLLLPTREPVRPGAFKAFLQHVDIDKTMYVRNARSNL